MKARFFLRARNTCKANTECASFVYKSFVYSKRWLNNLEYNSIQMAESVIGILHTIALQAKYLI